jgi:hypothetical protein
MTAFEKIQNALKSGAYWVTGDWLKQLLSACISERAKAGTAMIETPASDGRYLGVDETKVPTLDSGADNFKKVRVKMLVQVDDTMEVHTVDVLGDDLDE